MNRLLPLLAIAALAACRRSSAPQASADTVRVAAPASPVAATAVATAMSAATRDSIEYTRSNLPYAAINGLFARGHLGRYELYIELNPFFQRGLFDADALVDVAVRIRQKATGKTGIAIIHAADSTVHILGAGTPFFNGGDDSQWAWVWRVEPGNFRPDIRPVGREILVVEKPESAGLAIWWNGTRYVRTQHGD